MSIADEDTVILHPKKPRKKLWLLVICILLAAMFFLCGCTSEREQAQANAAATIWEAADATEKGADPKKTMPAIKANAAAIIKSTGTTYEKAGVQ